MNKNTEKSETFSFEVTAEIFDFKESQFEYLTEKELINATVIDLDPNLSKIIS